LLTCVGVWLWGVVEGYTNPKHATDRKDVVQAFTLVLTGIVGSISTIVGLVRLYFSRQNLKLNQEVLLKDQQDTIKTLELETRRASMSSCSRILSESPTSSDCKCELQVENKEETRYIETR
jgi:hypothetical protein